jgi:AcrR family transcriptional regulator
MAGPVPNTDRPPRRKRPSRRDELLAVAAQLFAERGFAGVTVDDIGAAAGVSGPALYHHFDSKEAMLSEMLIDISEHLLTGGQLRRDLSAPDRLLDDLIDWHVDFAVDNRSLITVHFRDLHHARTADRRRIRLLQRQYADIWVAALIARKPGLADSSAQPAVHGVFGLINSTPFSARTRRSDMVGLLGDMARGAFAAVGPGAA